MKWPLDAFWYDLWEKILGETFMKRNYIRCSHVRY
ncbi:hypothetical protein HL13_gp74 [Dinoroseobacter phage DFL12phi1]|uniref:Uncharacterized protein n=1 Tax=Dinoroseobacter phage DFL12phi1 TaxID=1477404 RepID=A0A023NHW0_9CAUD|nr:hypothetical protein HL13_gp74 [Dinoroseobacter phage DFL12phi1]AHX01034.1 hypothetical protein DFL12P1_0074 [Dinoroseobacter phage DFL12phi1]